MKQRISVDQLQELTPEQKERLREWWKPQEHDVFAARLSGMTKESDFDVYEVMKDGEITAALDPYDGHASFDKAECLPLLSIGQCIEFLRESVVIGGEVDIRLITGPEWLVKFDKMWILGKKPNEYIDTELIDALWEAVKKVL